MGAPERAVPPRHLVNWEHTLHQGGDPLGSTRLAPSERTRWKIASATSRRGHSRGQPRRKGGRSSRSSTGCPRVTEVARLALVVVGHGRLRCAPTPRI